MRIGATIAALALVFSLSACSDADSPEETETSSEATQTAVETANPDTMPTLNTSGQFPILDFPNGEPPAGLRVLTLETGSGQEITADDIVVAHYVGQVWGNSDPFDSSFERGAPSPFPLKGVIAGWTQGISGLPAGSKIIISIPAELGYGPSGGNPTAGIGAEDTIAFYIELLDAFAPMEAGQADAQLEVDLAELPVEITGELGAPIEIRVKDGVAEPTEPVVTVIARGTGEPIGGAGTTIYDQYAMSLWDNSATEVSYGSYGPQAQTLGSGNFFDLLSGIPVGSRVLIEVPEGHGGTSAPAYAVVLDLLGQVAR